VHGINVLLQAVGQHFYTALVAFHADPVILDGSPGNSAFCRYARMFFAKRLKVSMRSKGRNCSGGLTPLQSDSEGRLRPSGVSLDAPPVDGRKVDEDGCCRNYREEQAQVHYLRIITLMLTLAGYASRAPRGVVAKGGSSTAWRSRGRIKTTGRNHLCVEIES
jgi:hypothetical protein